MTLSDLHNPRNILCIFHKKQALWIEKSDNQGWNEYPGSVELWEVLPDGTLMRVQRWLKRSILIVTQANRVQP